MLECQARQTLAAARAAAHALDLDHLREVAAHGFHYLEQKMWDRRFGGWYRMMDRKGIPLEGATKHGHGSSYAISACVACYELTGDPACLALAQHAFSWLEQHAHDDRNGGYFVFYQPDGTPIVSPDNRLAPDQTRDPIGTPLGFKDANTTSDLLWCFADLYGVWPDPRLRTRLEEMLVIVRDRLVVAPGVMHMFAHPDWTPLPDFVRYGQVLRSANHLLAASAALTGAVDPTTARVVKSMVDAMLRAAWDRERGGFHLAGSSFGPSYVEEVVVFERLKSWWVQAEGLRVLVTMARNHPAHAAEYEAHFARLWKYVRQHLIDAKHGGWFSAGLDTNPEAKKRPKATMWRDVYHEVEAVLDCLVVIDPAL
jgi:mannobiose 2-epimerase